MNKKERKEIIEGHIKAGLNFKETEEELEKAGIDYPGLNGVYYRWKQNLFPNVSDAVEKVVQTQKVEKKPREKFSKKKQKDADESRLAELINSGLYHFSLPLCKNKKLKEEDLKDINVGGGIVASVQYIFPGIDLDNPLIVLFTRLILFYLRFKQICGTINLKLNKLKGKFVSDKTDAQIEQEQYLTGLAEDNKVEVRTEGEIKNRVFE